MRFRHNLGSVCSYQYFLRAEKEKSYELYRNLEESYESTVGNTPITETSARNEYHFFNLALILITTIAAVIVIYSIQMKGQMRSMQLFRIIGVTKKQLSVIIFYETMLILLPALVCGIAAGILSTWIVLRVLMEQSVSLFYISIPMMFIIGILLIWFGSVFCVRFLIFRYFLRGNLSARKRLRSWGRQERQNHYHALCYAPFGFEDMGKEFSASQGFLFGMDTEDQALGAPLQKAPKSFELLPLTCYDVKKGKPKKRLPSNIKLLPFTRPAVSYWE